MRVVAVGGIRVNRWGMAAVIAAPTLAYVLVIVAAFSIPAGLP